MTVRGLSREAAIAENGVVLTGGLDEDDSVSSVDLQVVGW